MEQQKVTRLCRKDFDGIKAGSTALFPLEDETCVNRCRTMVKMANMNWVKGRNNLLKFVSSYDSKLCIFSVTAVRKEA